MKNVDLLRAQLLHILGSEPGHGYAAAAAVLNNFVPGRSVMTLAPPRPDVDELERLVTDPPAGVCHLHEDGQVLCGALFSNALPVQYAEPDPAASPCVRGCGRNRCAPCAAEYTIRMGATP